MKVVFDDVLAPIDVRRVKARFDGTGTTARTNTASDEHGKRIE